MKREPFGRVLVPNVLKAAESVGWMKQKRHKLDVLKNNLLKPSHWLEFETETEVLKLRSERSSVTFWF